ncbi:hypothetical protein [Rhodoferax sp.]|uniref:hypothetical protein n=1 Tax=Rhodoferax sp. TaxID=50421 RepID=UPI00374D829A
MVKQVGTMRQAMVWCLLLGGCGFGFGAAASPMADASLAASNQSPSQGFVPQTVDSGNDSSVGSGPAAQPDAPPKRALSKGAENLVRAVAAPATSGGAQAAESPSPSTADGEWLRSTYKDMAKSSGAVDALQSLNSELNADKGGITDSTREAETDPAVLARRRAEGGAGPDGRAANTAPRSAEQLKLEEAQASFLFSELVREVTPWLIGAAIFYCCIYGTRLMLAYSRMKAERKRKRRRSRSSTSSRNARLE